MREGLGRSALLGLILAGTVAGAMTLYRNLGRLSAPPSAPKVLPPAPVASQPSIRASIQQVRPSLPEKDRGQTIELGNLSVVGTGGPTENCEPGLVAMWVNPLVRTHTRPILDICRALRPLRRGLLSCLQAALDQNPIRPRSVDVSIHVDRNGKISRVAVDDDEFGNDASSTLESCLPRTVQRLRLGRGEEDDVSVGLFLVR
jgi:hypothetical protein